MIAVSYAQLPAAVESVHVLVWEDGRSPVDPPSAAPPLASESRAVAIECASGEQMLVVFARRDGAYVLDGPFMCPDHDVGRRVDPAWRRTLRIRAPPVSAARPDVAWMPATGDPGASWPRCVWAAAIVECWGSAVGESGVLLLGDADRVWWTPVIAGGAVADFQSSAWGRLIVAGNASGYGPLKASVAHAVSSPQRGASVRLETAAVPGAHAIAIADGAVWVYGAEVPSSAWIELRAARAGPVYLLLDDVARAAAALPLWVTLGDERRLDGVARGTQGNAAVAAVVTLFRLIDPPPARPDARDQPRRVFAAERIAGASGEFQFDSLGDTDYEVVAWHPQFGRGVAAVGRGETTIAVRLESAGQVRGRVMAGGKPMAGVDVISLPDPQAVAQAADLTDIKGGDGRTGADGRFAVSVAPGGGGEVRVGGGRYPIRRFPLPRAPLPLVDLGDIDLGAPIEVTITLDREPGCDVRATGPVGRSGLQVITGTRVGPGLFRITFPEEGTWQVHLLCGRDEHALEPSLVSITQANSGKEIRMAVR